jgi:hypothetical protein
MTNAPALFRSLLVYGICLPLAVVLGYMVATPLDLTSLGMEVIVLSVLAIPLLLRWHHIWLIAAWNSTAMLFLIPGKPAVWMLLAAISLVISILQYAVNRNMRFLSAPSVAWPLLFFTVVILATARVTGGLFSARVFGGDTYGSKKYFEMLAAVVGFFAIISRPIPPKRAGLYVLLFFLGAGTAAIANLPGIVNPAFNFLFLFFPVMSTNAFDQNSVVGPMGLPTRFFGLANLGLAVYCLVLARYGIRGLLDATKPWRLGLLCLAVPVSMMGGFRSTTILLALTFALLFYFEGLHRTRFLLPAIFVLLLGGSLLTLVAARLPYAVQRSLAFLPIISIDPMVRFETEGSTEWRLGMWRDVMPEIPRYLLVGKGYSFSGNEQYHMMNGLEAVELVGDYHNGPLSVIIPFGIFGSMGFVWLLIAGIRLLYQNWRFGDPAFQHINTFLLAYFVAKVIFFFAIFGSLHSDLPLFLGLLGLSISLNGGVAKPAVVS